MDAVFKESEREKEREMDDDDCFYYYKKNPSHWKQTPTVDQLENPRSLLFYIRMQ